MCVSAEKGAFHRRPGICLHEEQQQRCLLLHVCVSLFLWSADLVSFRLPIGLDLRRLPLTRAACCHRILLRSNCRRGGEL